MGMQWYQFKNTLVVCKGEKDNLVVKNSCFVEYKLKFNYPYIFWCIIFIVIISFFKDNEKEYRRRGTTHLSRSIARTRLR